MSIVVKWITFNGKQTQKQTNIVPIFKEKWRELLKEFNIRRTIPLYIVDEKSWKTMHGNPTHGAEYNTGVRIGRGAPHEAVFLRERMLLYDNAAVVIERILRHELVHAKLKGKENGDEHSPKIFGKEAKKRKRVGMIGDY